MMLHIDIGRRDKHRNYKSNSYPVKFKRSRTWLKKNFDGQRIGFKKLTKVSRADWEDVRLYSRHSFDYLDIRMFLFNSIGKTYQKAWEEFLKLIKPILGKSKKSIKDAESTFKSYVGIPTGNRINEYFYYKNSSFYINRFGIIDVRWTCVWKDFSKLNRNYPKYIKEYNLTRNMVALKRQKLSRKAYILNPYTNEISIDPVEVYVMTDKRWDNRNKGKDYNTLSNYIPVIVPGWTIHDGVFLIKKEK